MSTALYFAIRTLYTSAWLSPISFGLWPLRSLDITPLSFFLYGLRKGRLLGVGWGGTRIVDYLRIKSTSETLAVPPAVLTVIFANTERWSTCVSWQMETSFSIFCNQIFSKSTIVLGTFGE
jgi:hypothetical protein